MNMQYLLFIMAGMGFFSSSSVSFSERSDALWTNPAGLGLHGDGIELQSGFSVIEGDVGFNLGFASGFTGLGYRTGSEDSSGNIGNIWTSGIGIPIGKHFRIGTSYFWGESKYWNFGLQANPWNWLALGAQLETGDPFGVRAGIGLRPFTDRVTLFGDVSYCDGLENVYAGMSIEPLSGVILSGSVIQPLTDGDLAWQGGLELAFEAFKLGAGYSSEGEVGISLGVSFPRYPGITFKKPGPKVVEWVPRGRSEEPAPSGFKIGAISFGSTKSKTFYDLLTEIRDMGDRKDIKGVLLDFRGAGYSWYQVEEIRKELVELKEKGKKIVAFSEGFAIGSYYLASVADRIYMVPTGNLSLHGGYARTLHIKGALDKLGIESDYYRVGEYKSAYELVNLAEPSEEDIQQLEAYLNSLYSHILTAIERDRGIPRAEFEKIMNERILFNGDTALALGLVDSLCLALDLDSIVDIEFSQKVERAEFAKIHADEPEVPRSWLEDEEMKGLLDRGKIAIVVAEGSIVTGESGSNPLPIPLIGGKYMGSTTVSELLDEIREDKQIKAVVFRINSGGGSALASEIINRALTDLAAEKPLVVSMAGVAGSGGYYIAAPGDKIFADATTITGSIGILGGKFVTKGLNDKLGITHGTIKIYPHADMFSPDRPFDETESELMQRFIDQGYAEFVTRVAEGRDMTFDEVDEVARGRIWTGTDAVQAGLVDEVGGLMEAVGEARRLAELDEDCKVVIYPKARAAYELDDGIGVNLLSLDQLPSWINENTLYIIPYEIELPMD
ncbi:signal peptide peptidase SppA [candidate division WOR-3 bacterium]|uniref:Signal peptide peptidase SppA n=1 Tax=candidate division WOR-3 bacterium TaxID=2052148 RepID=A0A9D5QDK7_UNCW3|nr:signal peptide peptidase SppA [candidate division WOR-3 bacterium]MBD3365156.1 signal peptide peptidase SppA [candidate division WOR-3 bacterium]